MNKKPSVSIVGAGPGGLASAILLAHLGFEVDMYEKGDHVGGRTARITLGEYTFDTGPTFFILPQILEEVFEEAGYNLNDYVKIKRLDPMYRLQFTDTALDMTQDQEEMAKRIEVAFPGSGEAYKRFMKEERPRFDAIFPLLQKTYSSWGDLFDRRVFNAMPKLSAGRSVIDVLSDYFDDERLQLSFTFQSKYLGMSPWDCPGLFAILPYIEHMFGIFHVEGGLNQLMTGMETVAKELGVRIHLERPVEQVVVQNGKAIGVQVAGKTIESDEVIVNADVSYAIHNLLPKEALKQWTPERTEKSTYSCSTFMLYLGIDREIDLPHNTIFFSKDYRGFVESIGEDGKLVDDISFYLCNPPATESTMAPEGKTALYVLVPISNNRAGIDWDSERERFRDVVIDAIEERLDISDLRDDIEEELCITPKEWEVDYNVFLGAVFNIGHQISQMLLRRPLNDFQDIDNCYLVGGGTHPGSGLPTIFESGRITAHLLAKKYGYDIVEPRSLERLYKKPQY